jgi:hypothetical protein
MSDGQLLAGAMGCASWRCRYRLREHAVLAPFGGLVRGGERLSLVGADVVGLNEVGVTDLIMAALWRFGPQDVAYAVTSGAESGHLGADIAILRQAASRILLYQAKIAVLENDVFKLKSPLTDGQIRMLRKRSVTIDDRRYEVTGRLALYQAHETPFIEHCPQYLDSRPWSWFLNFISDGPERDPEVARLYYDEVLASGHCSPSGIVAAPVRRKSGNTVDVTSTWPWEFDFYEWLRTEDGPQESDWDRRRREQYNTGPDFEPYAEADQIASQETPPERAFELAAQLAGQLRLPQRHQLYVLALP